MCKSWAIKYRLIKFNFSFIITLQNVQSNWLLTKVLTQKYAQVWLEEIEIKRCDLLF